MKFFPQSEHERGWSLAWRLTWLSRAALLVRTWPHFPHWFLSKRGPMNDNGSNGDATAGAVLTIGVPLAGRTSGFVFSPDNCAPLLPLGDVFWPRGKSRRVNTACDGLGAILDDSFTLLGNFGTLQLLLLATVLAFLVTTSNFLLETSWVNLEPFAEIKAPAFFERMPWAVAFSVLALFRVARGSPRSTNSFLHVLSKGLEFRFLESWPMLLERRLWCLTEEGSLEALNLEKSPTVSVWQDTVVVGTISVGSCVPSELISVLWRLDWSDANLRVSLFTSWVSVCGDNLALLPWMCLFMWPWSKASTDFGSVFTLLPVSAQEAVECTVSEEAWRQEVGKEKDKLKVGINWPK